MPDESKSPDETTVPPRPLPGNGLANMAIGEEEEDESKQWLTTYADMVTLLMTFFVLLITMSVMNGKRFEEVIQSIQWTMGANQAAGGKVGRIAEDDILNQALSRRSGLENEPLVQDLQEFIDKKNLDDELQVRLEGNKVILRISGQVLFPGGGDAMGDQAMGVLQEVAKVLKNYPGFRLDIKGHTDPRPINNEKFASNWELSALRATSVLRYLIELGISGKRMTATGYAATDPLVPNTTPENMAMNRRVEFVLQKEDQEY